MAKFAVGQAVEIAFNPPRPDLRVPDQANGKYPGRGDYQTRPNRGVVLEVHETAQGMVYLVEVELTLESEPHPVTGAVRSVTSFRKRHIMESKLSAL